MHGVVYAVRFIPSDVTNLMYNAVIGIKAFMHIPPDRLLGKIFLPKRGFSWDHVSPRRLEAMHGGLVESLTRVV